MSTYYWLVDKLSRTFYDLGAGNWFFLSDDLEVLHDKTSLDTLLVTQVFSGDLEPQTISYLTNRVSKDLNDLFGISDTKDLAVVRDGGDDWWILRCLGYKCVGHRFEDYRSQSYYEVLDCNNRHLKEDGSVVDDPRYSREVASAHPHFGKWA